jgi:hypothetical protein
MVVVYVLDVAEFHEIVASAQRKPQYRVRRSDKGYYRIESDTDIVFNRKEMKMKPAVWYGLFTGGLNGEIAEFGRDEVRVIGTNKPL